ncbi:NAD-dependent epimerase/dehydratase family protein [Cellulophaga sp. Hel_I_12]|uniref:NAD-dependent epimerase/dehydratase family protein n=1 Tax=Cellulophaga sp. Hel_I_12 TaxID=1249972 RepID=UPI0006476A87|nr:NAD-dependent epimerase/dehydratase family protein [Cellulophaga sp. Hel_I_12]
MKNYIVTGGAGFIGSHIVEYLVQMGHQVTVIDSLRTGFEKNLEGLNVRFFEEDIRNKKQLERIITNTNGVFHLAALVSVPESLLKIKECIDINTIGTLNILDAAKNNLNCKVVLSTSAANYGDNLVSPKVETMTPDPKTPYAITKLDGEYYLNMFSDQYKVPTISLRYFNVFGPRQNPKSAYAAAVPIFINNALQNKTITIYGDGLQTRDFIYVKDVVKANILASKVGKGTFNVALGHSTSILELAQKIIELTNSRSEIQFLEERSGDIKHSKADPSKFNALGFKPDYSIEASLKETIKFYDAQLSAKINY